MAKVAQQQMNDGTADEENESILEYSQNIEDQERPPVLPIGEYQAEITGLEKKFGKDSGKPYLNVKMRIDPDNQPADFVEATGGLPVTVFGMVFGAEDNPQSRFNMKQFCQAAGVPGSSRINPKEFLSKTVKVQIDHQKDLSGNDQPRVKRIVAT